MNIFESAVTKNKKNCEVKSYRINKSSIKKKKKKSE